MTKPNIILVAAFLVASTFPRALAQTGTGAGTDMETGGSIGTEVPGIGTIGTAMEGTASTHTGATTEGQWGSRVDSGYQHIVVSLNASAAMEQDWAMRLEAISEDTDVTILQRPEIEDSEGVHTAMFDQALSDLEADQDAIRSAVDEDQAFSDALEDEGYSADDVIGLVVYEGADSEVFVIVEGDGGN